MWASESVDVAVPVNTAYREWARFESFPRLLHGVQQQIERVDETRATGWPRSTACAGCSTP